MDTRLHIEAIRRLTRELKASIMALESAKDDKAVAAAMRALADVSLRAASLYDGDTGADSNG